MNTGNTVILDGGLATELEKMGHNLNHKLWSASLLLENPESILNIHKHYISAGAEIITTATYQASMQGLSDYGLSLSNARRLLSLSVDLARQAKKSLASSTMIAGSVGPYGAYLADGSEYTGDYSLDTASLKQFHIQHIATLDQLDIDILACETIPNLQEAIALNEILQNCLTPSWICFSCNDRGQLHDGTPVEQAARLFIDNSKVIAVGINCTAPDLISDLIKRIKSSLPQKPIVVYPNSGEHYCGQTKQWHQSDSGKAGINPTWQNATQWKVAGAGIIGGCCRTGPHDIAHLSNIFKDH